MVHITACRRLSHVSSETPALLADFTLSSYSYHCLVPFAWLHLSVNTCPFLLAILLRAHILLTSSSCVCPAAGPIWHEHAWKSKLYHFLHHHNTVHGDSSFMRAPIASTDRSANLSAESEIVRTIGMFFSYHTPEAFVLSIRSTIGPGRGRFFLFLCDDIGLNYLRFKA